ncbi:phage portal protein [Rossellomorea sp. DA94]|uniref:phage portal protein n=1 Tax=Rossellomorea sp. DA94 TaxID=3038653 RepID=UPI00244CEF73|nr:phage portal protein [Rossellomorea sp. DA94]WGG47679.1 phage portal protein [Rossellomorea sp. DA94]
MGFMDKMKNAFKPNNSYSLNSDEVFRMLGIPTDVSGSKLGEITYFTCLRLLSESLAKLPLKLYQDTSQGTVKVMNHPLYPLLKRPNPYMTASNFWSSVEINRNHYGNAYVLVDANRSGIKNLWILPSDQVQIWVDDGGIFSKKNAIWYLYTDKKSGKVYKYRHDEILHFKTSVSLDGISGLSVKGILKIPIENAQRNSSYLNNYYKNGLMGKAVVYYSGELDNKAARKMTERIEDFASGTDKAGKIVPLPVGFQLQPLNINMTDAQFLEITKHTALQIAGAFGIKPSMINNYDKGNYANVETQQRDFYVNTLLYNLKSYEEEISYKLLSNDEINNGFKLKWNVNGILRADFKTQSEGISRYVSTGILTPNEGREMLDMPFEEFGDKLIVNGTYIKLEDVGKQYGVDTSKGGDENGLDEG